MFLSLKNSFSLFLNLFAKILGNINNSYMATQKQSYAAKFFKAIQNYDCFYKMKMKLFPLFNYP